MAIRLAPPEQRVSEAEYLAFEDASPYKHEYVLGWVRALVGADRRHNDVTANLLTELHTAARRVGCKAYGSDMRLRVSGEIYYYPDVTVVCDPTDREPFHKSRPCVIVEVLSPSTASVDRGEKLLAYRGIASLQNYLLVSTMERRVERHWRDEQGAWQREDVVGDGAVAIPCLGLRLSLEAIYAGVHVGSGEPSEG